MLNQISRGHYTPYIAVCVCLFHHHPLILYTFFSLNTLFRAYIYTHVRRPTNARRGTTFSLSFCGVTASRVRKSSVVAFSPPEFVQTQCHPCVTPAPPLPLEIPHSYTFHGNTHTAFFFARIENLIYEPRIVSFLLDDDTLSLVLSFPLDPLFFQRPFLCCCTTIRTSEIVSCGWQERKKAIDFTFCKFKK